jgi:glucoamylase
MSVTDATRYAPGWPGIEPRWTTSAKSAVGTAFGEASRVWFTASHGILNEIYFPEVDSACVRDAGFLVAAAGGFRSEEKRHCRHSIEWLAAGVPAFRLTNRCTAGRYVIEKRLCCSPSLDAVVQHVRFVPERGALTDYELVFLLAPHLGNHGMGNTGWCGSNKGTPVLFARRDRWCLAAVCDAGWRERSAAFVGEHDAWHNMMANGRLMSTFERAENGNVALAGTVDLARCGGIFTIAIGFGLDPETAATHARAALLETFDATEQQYSSPWQEWQATLLPLDEPPSASLPHLYRAGTAVLRTHLTSNTDGGVVASLSVPWGDSKGDGDLGGYHLVWPRDMVQTAGGFLAAGAHAEVRAMLRFLAVTQEADGHWPQNMWLNGLPFWNGVQLDETAFPILLADMARREGVLDPETVVLYWKMVRRAAAFVVNNGPATEQDRWEEDAGFSPFTLAVEIAALLAAAELADLRGEAEFATHLRETADDWNDSIERWTYVEDTPLAGEIGVKGYYIRIGSADGSARVAVKNRSWEHSEIDASRLVSTDALALVRFGLRPADDRRIVDTVRVIDAMLRVETKTGPVWHRYNEDGYGEHEDGSAFDGTGVGRGWPLLAGERAHFELAAGRWDEAERLAAVMRAQASDGGLLPEQVWDAEDLAERGLFNGRPAGSAMPLVWAHAEYLKLLRSLRDRRVFDMPPQAAARYVAGRNVPRVASWRTTLQRQTIPAGRALRIDSARSARVRWTSDSWATWRDIASREVVPGVFAVELPTETLPSGTTVSFTMFWPAEDRWEGRNFDVALA